MKKFMLLKNMGLHKSALMTFFLCWSCSPSPTLEIRERAKTADELNQTREFIRKVPWVPQKTAIVIVDMWNNHHCRSAAQRVVEMAPHMNKVINAARRMGVFIIHAPSDCMEFYEETPQRTLAQNAPLAETPIPFQWNNFNPEHEGNLEMKLENGGCSCDTTNPCGPDYRAWNRQIAAIQIAKSDAISDSGQEIFNLLQERGINDVIIMGVHTNRCVLGRPFGIRQMVYLGKNVYLCRDLTDSYHRDPGKHFEGLEKIIQHVERYWCPTITSESITGEPRFWFQGQKKRILGI